MLYGMIPAKNTHNLDQIYSRSNALYIHRYNFMRQVLLQSKEFTLPFPAAEKFPRLQGRWCQTRAAAFSLHATPFVLGTNILHFIVLGTLTPWLCSRCLYHDCIVMDSRSHPRVHNRLLGTSFLVP